ncbi:acyl-CoA dehydrogenase family protein [Jannaschia sp. LMIT008]|uniref:acyl-CoA dehydrogenase family protein n=1 Tax=Jannaschia maritima TaxID=3032585 RepID=UPI0035AB8FC1
MRRDPKAGMAEPLAARVARTCADDAVQVHGGDGFAREYDADRLRLRCADPVHRRTGRLDTGPGHRAAATTGIARRTSTCRNAVPCAPSSSSPCFWASASPTRRSRAIRTAAPYGTWWN